MDRSAGAGAGARAVARSHAARVTLDLATTEAKGRITGNSDVRTDFALSFAKTAIFPVASTTYHDE